MHTRWWNAESPSQNGFRCVACKSTQFVQLIHMWAHHLRITPTKTLRVNRLNKVDSLHTLVETFRILTRSTYGVRLTHRNIFLALIIGSQSTENQSVLKELSHGILLSQHHFLELLFLRPVFCLLPRYEKSQLKNIWQKIFSALLRWRLGIW